MTTHAQARRAVRLRVGDRLFDGDGRPLPPRIDPVEVATRGPDAAVEALGGVRPVAHPRWDWIAFERDGGTWITDGRRAWRVADGGPAAWIDVGGAAPDAGEPLDPVDARRWLVQLADGRAAEQWAYDAEMTPRDPTPGARAAAEAEHALDHADDDVLFDLLHDRVVAGTAAELLLDRPWVDAHRVALHPFGRLAGLRWARAHHPPWAAALALESLQTPGWHHDDALELVVDLAPAPAFELLGAELDATTDPHRRLWLWKALARLDRPRALPLVGAARLHSWSDRCGMQAVLHGQRPPSERAELDRLFTELLVLRIREAASADEVADDAVELARCLLTQALAPAVRAAAAARGDRVGAALLARIGA